MSWFFIYTLSAIITGIAILGILVSSRNNENITCKGIFHLVLITVCPVLNTIAALTILIAVGWLYWFRPTKAKPKPPV